MLLQLNCIIILGKNSEGSLVWELQQGGYDYYWYDYDEDDEQLAGFMPSHLDSEPDSFRETASLMQRTLEWRRACDDFIFC